MGSVFYCQLAACAIAAGAFAYGAVHFIKKGTPLYQQIILWSVGCFGLFMIATTFNSLVFTVRETEVNVSLISVFGCLCALFSANYGAMDKVVEDAPGQNKLPKTAALLIAGLFALAIAGLFVLWQRRRLSTAIFLSVAYLPMIPAVYYNIKHLLLPVDDMGLLKNNRGVNILSVVFYCSLIAHALLLLFRGDRLILGISYIVSSCIMFAVTVSAKKGIVRW